MHFVTLPDMRLRYYDPQYFYDKMRDRIVNTIRVRSEIKSYSKRIGSDEAGYSCFEL